MVRETLGVKFKQRVEVRLHLNTYSIRNFSQHVKSQLRTNIWSMVQLISVIHYVKKKFLRIENVLVIISRSGRARNDGNEFPSTIKE